MHPPPPPPVWCEVNPFFLQYVTKCTTVKLQCWFGIESNDNDDNCNYLYDYGAAVVAAEPGVVDVDNDDGDGGEDGSDDVDIDDYNDNGDDDDDYNDNGVVAANGECL